MQLFLWGLKAGKITGYGGFRAGAEKIFKDFGDLT